MHGFRISSPLLNHKIIVNELGQLHWVYGAQVGSGGVVCRGGPCDKRPGAAPVSDRAGYKMDPTVAKTEPSSNASGISVKTRLRRGNKHCPRATIEKSEEKVQKKTALQTQVCEEGGGRSAPGAGADCPAAHGEGCAQVGYSSAAQEGQHGNRNPPCSRDLCPEGSCSPRWSPFLRAAATLAQFLKDWILQEGAHAGAMEECRERVAMTKCHELTTTAPPLISLY